MWIDLLNERVRWTTEVDWSPSVSPTWSHLRRFHLHYMEYAEAFTDDELRAAVDSWIAENPPYRPGYWYDSWSSYVISLRAVVWMQQLAARPGLPSDFVARASESICLQMRVLADHLELDLRGNHLVKNVKALLWAGAFFTGTEAAAWQARGEQLLSEILDEQILPDGMHYELSASYHAQVFADLLECAEVMPEGAARDRLVEAFPRLARALVCMTHPDGGPALFNDSGLTMAHSAEQILDVARRHTGETPVPDGAFCLPDAGYYGFRNGGDYLLVKAGRIGPDALPGHAHADLLSFEWDVGGQRIVVDPGVSEYEQGEARQHARSTAAHNTIAVDGADQSEMWSAFRVGRRSRARVLAWEHTPDGLILDAECDFYGRSPAGVGHRRRFALAGRKLTVEDRVRGAGGASATVLLHPSCKLTPCEGGHEVVCANAAVRIDVPAWSEEATWMPDLGVSQPTHRLVSELGASATLKTLFHGGEG